MLSKIYKFLKTWKPIHLCWLFEKYELPIPLYFIGGAAVQEQDHYKIGDDDNADPDSCSFDSLDTERTGQAKNSNFMIRIQVHDEVADAAAAVWNLYYNSVDNAGTATQVTTASGVVKIVDGTPNDGTATDDSTVVFDASGSYSWVDGEYTESDDSDKLATANGEYTDLQWCVQFDDNADDETTYYFYARRFGGELGAYNEVAKCATAAGEEPEPPTVSGPFHSLGGFRRRR